MRAKVLAKSEEIFNTNKRIDTQKRFCFQIDLIKVPVLQINKRYSINSRQNLIKQLLILPIDSNSNFLL